VGARNVSDRVTFDSFNIRFFSDVIPDEVAKELADIKYSALFEEAANGLTQTIELVKFSMTSGNTPDNIEQESDSLAVSTVTTDNKGKPYTQSNTLSVKEETPDANGSYFVIRLDVPKQVIGFTERGQSGDVRSDLV